MFDKNFGILLKRSRRASALLLCLLLIWLIPGESLAAATELTPAPEQTAAVEALSQNIENAETPAPTEVETETVPAADTPVPKENIPVQSIALTGAARIAVCEQAQLQATVLPRDASDSSLAWSSSDPDVAEVDAQGVVTGRGRGIATITATAADGSGAQGSLEIEVYVPQPEKLAPRWRRLTLGVGQTLALEVRMEPEGAESMLAYTSSAAVTVSVSADGVVKGLKAGTATITIAAENGLATEIAVTVKEVSGALELEEREFSLGWDETLGLGESRGIAIVGRLGAADSYTYASDNEEAVLVDAEGIVTAAGPGAAKITVTDYDGRTAICTVQVLPAPQKILLPATLRLPEGETAVIAASVPNGTAAQLRYAPLTPAVLDVSETGELRGVAHGRAQVLVYAFNGLEAVCQVEVLPGPEKIIPDAATLTIGVGEHVKIGCRFEPFNAIGSLSYSTSNKKIATVDASGEVAGVRAGSATITIKAHNGAKATVKVTVKKSPASLTVKADRTVLGYDPALGTGETTFVRATLPSGSSGGCDWSSSDESVLLIDEDTGHVRAVGLGSAKVTATAYNGETASCEISVEAGPTSISCQASGAILGIGQIADLDVQAEGGISEISYESADPAVVSVEDGKLRALAVGDALVTVSTFNGHQVQVSVSVVAAPTSLTLSPGSYKGVENETLQLVPVIPEGTMAGFTWKSSNENVVRVDQNGFVELRKMGKATVTVATHNGLKATCSITVEFSPYVPEWSGMAVYPLDGMAIPILYQFNYTEPFCRIGSVYKTVKSSGCGAASMSMVIAYYGRFDQDPHSLMRWAYYEKYYYGSGLPAEALTAMGRMFGVSGKWIGRDEEQILAALRAGKPVVALMGRGTFTRGGHYIVLRGVTESGEILVNDPNNEEHTHMSFPLSLIIDESKGAKPFLICSKAN